MLLGHQHTNNEDTLYDPRNQTTSSVDTEISDELLRRRYLDSKEPSLCTKYYRLIYNTTREDGIVYNDVELIRQEPVPVTSYYADIHTAAHMVIPEKQFHFILCTQVGGTNYYIYIYIS